MVQLVGAAPGSTFLQSALSDSIGRYVLRDIPDGRYTIGFFHPVLDSLGLEPTLREVLVQNHRDTRMDLASPSAARLRRAVCGPAPSGASAAALGGVLVGTVHDARQGAPLANATVTVEWLELSFGSGGVTRRTPRLSITTRENGWYALCPLPNPGSGWLAAGWDGSLIRPPGRCLHTRGSRDRMREVLMTFSQSEHQAGPCDQQGDGALVLTGVSRHVWRR